MCSARFFHLDDKPEVAGTVVVMDVLRAFTTAAYAFGGGAREIVMVASTDEALALRADHPAWMLMGENGGRHIDGFDLSNSPAEIAAADVDGHTIVQRTGNGTRGVASVANANAIWCGSLVTASALARQLRGEVSYIITEGDEDQAGAEYIEASRTGPVDPAPFIKRIRASRAGTQLTSDSDVGVPADVELACMADRFDFAISVARQNGNLVATAI